MRTEIDFEELLKGASVEDREKMTEIMERFKEENPIVYVKGFVDNYEKKSMIDYLVAHVTVDVIQRTGRELFDAVEKTEGEGITGMEGASIIVTQLRLIADNIESASNQNNQKNSQ